MDGTMDEDFVGGSFSPLSSRGVEDGGGGEKLWVGLGV